MTVKKIDGKLFGFVGSYRTKFNAKQLARKHRRLYGHNARVIFEKWGDYVVYSHKKKKKERLQY